MSAIMNAVMAPVALATKAYESYSDINAATLSGAIDVVVVQHEDGRRASTPFHVRFGKMQVLRSNEKVVSIEVNGEPVTLQMKLGRAGEAYFVREAGRHERVPRDLLASPIASPRHDAASPPASGSAGDAQDQELKREMQKLRDKVGEIETDEDGVALRPGEAAAAAGTPTSAPDGGTPPSAPGGGMVSPTGEKLSWAWGQFPGQGEVGTPPEGGDGGGGSVVTPPDASALFLAQPAIPDFESRVHTLSGEITRQIGEEPKWSLFDLFGAGRAASEAAPGEAPGAGLQSVIRLSLCGHKMSALDAAAGDLQARAQRLFDEHLVDAEKFNADPQSIVSDPDLLVQIGNTFYPWAVAMPCLTSQLAFGSPAAGGKGLDLDEFARTHEQTAASAGGDGWGSYFWGWSGSKEDIADPGSASTPPKRLDIAPEASTERPRPEPPTPEPPLLRKDLKPTPAELAVLDLNPGKNTLKFITHSSIQGTVEVVANLYMWSADSKIVVSDVDGTITKSDVLGNLATIVGTDWSHAGVASLYTKIKDNGYELLYLTSRAIGQAHMTRNYIQTVEQQGTTLPDGPVIMSPDRLMDSFTREVIQKQSHHFKIYTLRDVRSLFPRDYQPFYAGFGNRDTDVRAYRAVDMEDGKIFIINPQGEIMSQRNISLSTASYSALETIAEQIFPKVAKAGQDETYNAYNFWKSDGASQFDLEDL